MKDPFVKCGKCHANGCKRCNWVGYILRAEPKAIAKRKRKEKRA